MSNYPSKLAVVIPDFVIVEGDESRGDPRRFVILNAIAILRVERFGRGFKFEEAHQVDETGTRGADLLIELTAHLDADTSLAGYRLDQLIGSLVQVPCDDPRDAACKPALLRLKASLTNEVQDAYWFDRDRYRSMEDLAADYELPAEWHRATRQGNPNMLERELSAKAQSAWLCIAHELLTADELRRATTDYDHWRTASSIA